MANAVTHPGQDSDFALAGLSSRARVWLLTVACFGVLLVISSMVALNTALPDIAIATSADQTQLTWIVDSYTLVLACLLLPAGALGDRYGRRGAMLVGLAIFGAASLVSAVLSNPLIVIVSRGVAGAGAALIMPATLSLITAAYPKDQRNKAVGIWAGVAGSGAVIGMLGSGGLLNFWSWHSIFWAFAGAALTILVLTLTIASSRDARREAIGLARRVGHRRRRGDTRLRHPRGTRARVDPPTGDHQHRRRTTAESGVRLRRSAAALSAVGCAAVRGSRVRHRRGHHHGVLPVDVRLHVPAHAVHAADPWLQPKQDGACIEPDYGPDARAVRAVFLVSAPTRPARGRVQRTPADRDGVDLHARHQSWVHPIGGQPGRCW